MSKVLSPWFALSLCTLGYLGVTKNPASAEARLALGEETLSEGVSFRTPSFLAQVTSDGTVNTQVNQNGNTAEITGGETRGNNLFHSFEDFSVETGNEAFFNNADSISDIFSRVTGGNVSDINGAIRASGSANLFLINPAGIIFGENASLNIGGSFYGSSASSILFKDGEFSATDLDNPPLLTINAPIGLGFRDQPGDITNNSVANDGNGLEVDSGKNISLLGGDVSFNGGRVTAPGGIINLGGLSTAGRINIDANNSLNFADEIAQSNVSLSDNAVVDVTSDGSGLITVNANNLELTEESLFLANIGEGLGSENAVAGTIEVNSNSFSADNNSLIHSDNLGIGKAGTINITTDILNLTSGSAITATTFGVGDAGTINVTAQNIALDQEFTGIYSNVGLTNIASESEELNVDGVVGNGGVINVDTDTLSLANGARIISSSIAQGNGGTVNINATGAVSYIGEGVTPVPAFGGGPVISGSFSQVQQDSGNGNAGEVNITANSLSLVEKGAVLTDNSGVGGDAGNITLNIKNDIFLDQTGLILAQVQAGAEGNGGDINITAGSLKAQGNSLILADTKGIGDAGNINIDVEKTLSLDQTSVILTEVGLDAVGNAGDITITANSLIVKNGADIAAQTKGQGDAGNITVTTNDAISLEDSGEIISLVETNATGNGGNISLTSKELNLSSQSQIDATISAATNFEGGEITLDVTDNLTLDNNSSISAKAERDASGGNIDINANFIVAFPNQMNGNGNDITASATQGNGGEIDIKAESLFGITQRKAENNNQTNDIDASSEFGLNGTVSIFTPDLNPIQSVAKFPINVVEATQTAEQTCSADPDGKANNGLAIAGRGGVTPPPDAPLNSENINNENPAQASIPEPIETAQGKIQPARGIKFTKDGRIILTAYRTNNAGERIPEIEPNCKKELGN